MLTTENLEEPPSWQFLALGHPFLVLCGECPKSGRIEANQFTPHRYDAVGSKKRVQLVCGLGAIFHRNLKKPELHRSYASSSMEVRNSPTEKISVAPRCRPAQSPLRSSLSFPAPDLGTRTTRKPMSLPPYDG